MTWSETKLRWRVMREIEDLFLSDPAAELPWREDYAELFGDRDGLTKALRYRWQLSRDAQLDTYAPEAAWDEQVSRLDLRTRMLIRRLDDSAGREQGRDRVVA
ncbi:hypothetical protein F0U44_07155 [Nocardioides humilatus]|uniref:Uncharacterized protein n=1 Tax=Nocardioides humilatus TaxID=2607660 RepID=A0A5B1LID6_9ACTN|nr:hypothetical protein [Nocardioides humilatus]KAA1420196.1 hypothetical protein F0U44_07155 [Nocardioides humilatus]